MEWIIIVSIILIFFIIGLIFLYDSLSVKETKNTKVRTPTQKKSNQTNLSDKAIKNPHKKLSKEEKEELIKNTKEVVSLNKEKTAEIIRNWLKEEK